MSETLKDIVHRIRQQIDAGITGGSDVTAADFDRRDLTHHLGLRFGEFRVLLDALAAAERELASRYTRADIEAALDQAIVRGKKVTYQTVSSMFGDRARGQVTTIEGDLCDMRRDTLAALGRLLKEGKDA